MKRKGIIIGIIAVMFVVWLSFVIQVNAKFPKAVTTTYEKGETAILDGIQYEILDCIWLDAVDVKSYMGDADSIYDCDYKAMVITLQITNASQTTADYSLYECCVEGAGYTNGLCGELAANLSDGMMLSGELEPGETRIVRMPYMCVESMFAPSVWSQVEHQDFSLVVSLYPEKNALLVQ